MLVKIKTWDKMKEEYGGNNITILCRYSFTKVMEEILPKNRIINIDEDYQWKPKNKVFEISEDMIKARIKESYTIYGQKRYTEEIKIDIYG